MAEFPADAVSDGLLKATDFAKMQDNGLLKNKLDATVAPGATDDSAAGYAVGSKWVDVTADKAYVCLDATATAAVWKETTASAAGGEANTTSNAGAGEGTLAKAKVGVDLPIKSVKQGTNLTIQNNADDITLNVPDASTSAKGAVELATDGEAVSGVAIQGSDSRLTRKRYEVWRSVENGTVAAVDALDGVFIPKRSGTVLSVIAYCDVIGKYVEADLQKTNNPSVDMPGGGIAMLTTKPLVNAARAIFNAVMKTDGSEDFAANDVLHVDIAFNGGTGSSTGLTILVEIEYD
jgi:hypothetical protein